MVARCAAVRTATRTACSDLLCLCCRVRVAGDCAADCPERPAAHEERSGQAPAPRRGVWGAMRSLLGPRIPARRAGRLRCKLGEGMCSGLARPLVYAVQHCDVMQRMCMFRFMYTCGTNIFGHGIFFTVVVWDKTHVFALSVMIQRTSGRAYLLSYDPHCMSTTVHRSRVWGSARFRERK
jgi:hypothetical protein